MNAVIVVQLSGGLGNQMFQYATGRALAARRKTELVLDSTWIDGRWGSTVSQRRRFELGCFTLEAPLAPVAQVGHLPEERLARLRRCLPHRRPFLTEVVEPPFGSPVPELVDAADDTYLRGYWQNPAYFTDAERLLRSEFSFRAPIVDAAQELARMIRSASTPAVALHVRRADYVTDAGVRERLGPLGPDYYRRAVDVVASRVGKLRLFVFSDDPEWCRTTLRFSHETTVLDGSADAAARDLYLMRLCDHYVIANSSFSWWGAWLNPSPEKIVVAPRPWYRAAGKPDDHRTPPEWIRIDRDAYQADQPPSTTTFEPVT